MNTQRKAFAVVLAVLTIFTAAALTTPIFTTLYAFGQNLLQKMEVWGSVLNIIERYYFEDVEAERLVEDSIKGLLSSLDPHTVYLSKRDFDAWKTDFKGYFGIGVSYDIIGGKITVLSVNEYGPAFQSGLKAGDRIVSINGESAVGLKREEVPLRIMGPQGTVVRLGIERQEWDRPREFAVRRQHITTASVPNAFLIKPDIGYIRIARFGPSTVQEFDEAVALLQTQGMKRLVLDLRGNQGGLLVAAQEIAGRFIPAGKVLVYTKGRISSFDEEILSAQYTITPMPPLIVLIDHISASGSEIVAGAVQDWDRGLIAGLTSFGKGLVQKEFDFKDGSALLVTVAAYYTPCGRLIQREFSGRSREEYFTDPFNAAKADSTRKRLAYRTALGRTVYGGGGITPDVEIVASPRTFSPAFLRLYSAPERLFYVFCEKYARLHPELGTDAERYVADFDVPAAMYSDFIAGVTASGFKFSSAEFTQNRDAILLALKRELAFIYWGENGRFRVMVPLDAQLWAAVEHFDEAQRLLEARDFSLRELPR